MTRPSSPAWRCPARRVPATAIAGSSTEISDVFAGDLGTGYVITSMRKSLASFICAVGAERPIRGWVTAYGVLRGHRHDPRWVGSDLSGERSRPQPRDAIQKAAVHPSDTSTPRSDNRPESIRIRQRIII